MILAVPDVHSRKPNLRALLGVPHDGAGLEVFARNLTAGWWGWGDEALLFQHRRHWVLPTAGTEEDGDGGGA